MKNHQHPFLKVQRIDTSVRQQNTLSRRGMLLSIIGLLAAGCGQETTGFTLPAGTQTLNPTPPSSLMPNASHKQSLPPATTSAGKTLLTYKGHTGGVEAVGWSPDGTRIASADSDGGVQVWSASNGKRQNEYHGHTSWVGALAWSPDSTYIATGGSDFRNEKNNTIQVWNAGTGQRLMTYTGHTRSTTGIAWSPDGTHIISAGDDGTVQVWEAQSGKRILSLTVMEPNVPILFALAPDGQHIVAGVNGKINGKDQRLVKIYQSQTGDERLTYHDTVSGAEALSWSPDGKSIAMSQGLGRIPIWDAANGGDITNLQAVNSSVLALVWSPDGKYLASGGGSTQAVEDDNQAQVWNMASKRVMTYLGHSRPIRALSWSPDSTRIASASWDSTVQIWQAV